ncbi:MAG: FAD-dependent oxidoreductase [archaeon]|nr:FAD-dependent oxidoreductase [Candidatus Bathyarchaeum sp.]
MVNVAVIGTGVGGCSAAYFTRNYLSDPKITVYEADNRISGRVMTYRGNGIQKELGAEFFNFSNPIVSVLIEKLGLETKKLEDVKGLAVWNGTEVIFQSGQSLFYKMLALVNNYKLAVPKLLYDLKKSERNIKKLYKEQQKSPAEFWEIFKRVGLDKYYQNRFDKILEKKGIDSSFIDELITPITRIIYSQNAELGGFAGLIALLGVYSQAMYNIKDGNDVFPKKLLEASDSAVELNSKVTAVEKRSDGSFRVHTGERDSIFDAVIVAAPLEVAKISFDGLTVPEMPVREYQRIYVKLMKGQVNPRFFNLDSAKLPSIVLTSQEADPLTRFSINDSTKRGESWVTVTSTEPLDGGFVDELFKNGETVLDHSWAAAYPVFKPTEKLPNMFLDDRLVYVNAVESSASSMESSSFAALNCVQAIKEQLG